MKSLPCWLLLLASGMSGCSSLDQLAVGRSDRLPDAPYYVTYRRPTPAGEVVVLPVALNAVAAEHYVADGRGQALQPLLDAINQALAGQRCCRYLADPGLPDDAPQLYVGSVDGDHAPAGTGIEQQPHEEYPPMIAHLIKPGAAWRQAAADLARRHSAARVVIVELAFTQFPKADRGAFGKKVVLGSNYEERIRTLSAVDKPVEVIALTGLVVDASGEVLRAGAEGIIGADAPFWVQVLELGRDIDPAAIRRLTTDERRADLPRAPLKWRAALEQLLHQLLRPA